MPTKQTFCISQIQTQSHFMCHWEPPFNSLKIQLNLKPESYKFAWSFLYIMPLETNYSVEIIPDSGQESGISS